MALDFQHLEIFEQWRPVVDFEGRYEVSNWGRVRRVAAAKGAQVGELLNPTKTKTNPYFFVTLYQSLKRTQFQIHCLVAAAFIGPCPPGKEVHHLDGDKTNNCLPNLSYVTRGENITAEYESGRRKHRLTHTDLIEIQRLHIEGMTLRAIAKLFNTSAQCVHYSLKRQNKPQTSL